MNRIQFITSAYKLMPVLIALLLGQTSGAFAKESGCWADFYEYAQYIGEHIRINGPTGLNKLRNINGANWESRIDSLIVGPKAKVTLFENINFKLTLTEMAKHPDLMKSLGITLEEIKQDSELIFKPNEKINHLGMYNFHKKTKSLKIECL